MKEILEERGKRYGSWKNHAAISQDIQNAIALGVSNRGDGMSLNDFEPYMLETLVMISNKIGRIVNGDPYYDDSWRDIAGYATLVVEELEKDAEKKLQENRK